MRLLAALLLTLSFTAAQAATFNGKWMGEVNYTDSDGSAGTDTQSVYVFPYAPNHIYIADTFWGYQLDLEVVDGNLMWEGMNLGTITDSDISMYYVYDEGTDSQCTWKLNLGLQEDGSMTFNDGYSCVDGYFDATEGTLGQVTKKFKFPKVVKGAFKTR